MKKVIPYSTQSIDDYDIKSVVNTLKSDWLTTGPKIEEFERKFARFVGTKYAVAVSSGTAALHSACSAINLKPGDEVIVPAMSFVASANCVLYCGATPVLCDVTDNTLCLDVDKAEKLINKRTKAILAVDFAGQPADWDRLLYISKKYNVFLIDDAAHAVGSMFRNKMIGTIAHLTSFSFHPVKTITTGEGGMVVTNNVKFYESMRLFRNHGIAKDKSTLKKKDGWYYNVVDLGFNYRMTDIQAALGCSQLNKIRGYIAKRRKIWKTYQKELERVKGIRIPTENERNFSAWHLYPIRINQKIYGESKKQLYERLHEKGVHVQVHYIPINLHKLYRSSLGYDSGDFPVAEKYYKETLSLPLYPNLKASEQMRVINLLKSPVSKHFA